MTKPDPHPVLPTDHDVRLKRAMAALQGLSVGDGFGESLFPYFRRIDAIAARRELPPAPWRWTDDSAMAISIVQTLAEHGGIDQDALAQRFADRYDAEPGRGYGGMAHRILQAIVEGADWRKVSPSAFDGEGSMGNGGAMRVAPVGAYFADDFALTAEHARRSAEVTHAHPDGQAGAVAIAIATAWACRWRGEIDTDSPRRLFEAVLEHTPDSLTRSAIVSASELPLDSSVDTAIHALGNGSRVVSFDTVPYCMWCAARHLDSYVDALWTTVQGVGDMDTNAAIVGGIVAMSAGEQSIPNEWITARERLPRDLPGDQPKGAQP